jgi:hypothetical protein
VDGERVNAAREFGRKQLIDHAVTFEPGLSLERFRHDIDAIMSLAARPVSGVTFVLMRFVKHFEALRRESLGQPLCDYIGGPHAARLGEGSMPVNGLESRVLNGALAKAHNVRS